MLSAIGRLSATLSTAATRRASFIVNQRFRTMAAATKGTAIPADTTTTTPTTPTITTTTNNTSDDDGTATATVVDAASTTTTTTASDVTATTTNTTTTTTAASKAATASASDNTTNTTTTNSSSGGDGGDSGAAEKMSTPPSTPSGASGKSLASPDPAQESGAANDAGGGGKKKRKKNKRGKSGEDSAETSPAEAAVPKAKNKREKGEDHVGKKSQAEAATPKAKKPEEDQGNKADCPWLAIEDEEEPEPSFKSQHQADAKKKRNKKKKSKKGDHDDESRQEAAKPKTFTLECVQGNLFSCPMTDSLAHCVSKDLKMGKGIAVDFKKKFGGLDDLYKQSKGVGDVAVLERGDRFVYYLITKPRYHDKPTYDTLEESLHAMKEHCLRHDVTNLSMPRIGCGLDLLQWNKVATVLREVFGDTGITITVYSL